MFDSGVGGLTVARAVLDQLPDENLRYVADTANFPYGPKPIAQVRALALAVMDELVEGGVKMLVIACNSASAAVLHDARERYEVPVVEVIHPAARRAAAATRGGKVGVLCTQATKTSRAYDDAFAAVPGVQVSTQACPRFVDFVESGITSGEQVLAVTREYVQPVLDAGVDTLVLGCTHYPLLAGAISYVAGDHVSLVSSAEETAKDVFRVLTADGLLRPPEGEPPMHSFTATGPTQLFDQLRHRIMGPDALGA